MENHFIKNLSSFFFVLCIKVYVMNFELVKMYKNIDYESEIIVQNMDFCKFTLT